jgi:hypothetical protein
MSSKSKLSKWQLFCNKYPEVSKVLVNGSEFDESEFNQAEQPLWRRHKGTAMARGVQLLAETLKGSEQSWFAANGDLVNVNLNFFKGGDAPEHWVSNGETCNCPGSQGGWASKKSFRVIDGDTKKVLYGEAADTKNAVCRHMAAKLLHAKGVKTLKKLRKRHVKYLAHKDEVVREAYGRFWDKVRAREANEANEAAKPKAKAKVVAPKVRTSMTAPTTGEVKGDGDDGKMMARLAMANKRLAKENGELKALVERLLDQDRVTVPAPQSVGDRIKARIRS